MKNSHGSTRFDSSTGGRPLTPFEQSKGTRKRCKGVTRSGTPCTAWAMEGGLCYFHANPDKAAELGRKGGLRDRHTYEQSNEPVAPPESAADVKRMLAETMAEVKAGKTDPKVANTVAYLATVLLRAHEADAAASAETPAQPFVPLIYRSLRFRDGRKHEADDVIDLDTGERVALPAADVPCALPAPTRSAARIETHSQTFEVEIPDD